MPKFIGQSEEFQGVTFELTAPAIPVGRLADNRLQIEHSSVSGHHAELVLDELDYKVRDLDSTNGTRVNGERISEQKLRRNDIVRFGNVELLYDSEHSPPALRLPDPSSRESLSESRSEGRPAKFVNAAPIGKPAADSLAKSPWLIVLILLAFAAIGGVAYFYITVLADGLF
ncbi:MAG: FHA domain-containing protein [Candidatus Methylacidiphilales bacterium]|nr:FHA domain-containing protein [Candidatus Methylacidiphilales bacterium]